VLWTLDGEVWTRSIEGNPTPSAAETAALEALTPWISDDELYPSEPVAEGHRWKVQGETLKRYLAAGMEKHAIEAASMDLLFKHIVQHLGQRCALITGSYAATAVDRV